LGNEVHFKLNHILQGVLTSEAHRFFWCDHALSSLDLKGSLIGVGDVGAIGQADPSTSSVAEDG
jgi:hypothetical protein